MFNLETVEIKNDFAPLEAGWYGGHVTSMDWKESKAGARYVNLQIKLDNGRVIFKMLHIYNASEQARNIALADAKKMLLASGCDESKLNFPSEDALLEALATVNCEFYLKIKKDEQYGDKNEIGNYQARKSAAPTIDTSSIPF